MQKYFCSILFFYSSFLLAQEANHIILTQITTEPTNAEVIVIYNPTDNLNPINYYYIFSRGAERKEGVFSLAIDTFFGANKLAFVLIPDHHENLIPLNDSELPITINGLRPVMVHQRLDFFLYAMDQLINSAAKWSYTFGGIFSLPLTIRLIIGRGRGQGPTHSQSLQSLF